MTTDFNSKKKGENRNGEDGEFSAKGILGTASCGVSPQPAAKELVKEGGIFKSGQQRDQTQLYPTPHCTESVSPSSLWQTFGHVAFTFPACGVWFSFR